MSLYVRYVNYKHTFTIMWYELPKCTSLYQGKYQKLVIKLQIML